MSGKTKEMLERELDEALDEVEELHERLDSILEIAGAEEEDRLERDDVDGLLERLDSSVRSEERRVGKEWRSRWSPAH